MKSVPGGLMLILMIGLLGLVFLAPWAAGNPTPAVSYTQFAEAVSNGQVKRVAVSGNSLAAEYTTGERVRLYVPGTSRDLQELMLAKGVQVEYTGTTGSSSSASLFSWLLPLIMIGGLIWFMGNQGAGGGAGQVFSFGESRARLHSPGEKRVTMQDVAGMPEVKEELWEIVDFLRSPDRYLELGARIPKGVLLYGPPGTGKTLLARAVAGEAGVPFYSISGSDFVEIFAGVGASRVRDLFTKARRHAPCIIFVDEIDAVGRQRGMSMSGGSDEREQTLNQLLVEMDGFSTAEGIIVMAATNRLDILDRAILRPGRFDRQIGVDPPDRQGRSEILRVHAAGKPMAEDVDMAHVAGMTAGFTGADLANLLNEAALLAARRRQEAIGLEEIRAAYERIIVGGPPSRRGIWAVERLRVAFHEAGHAVVSRHLAHADPIEKVTIVPRGRAMGYVMYQPGEDRNLHTRAELIDRMVSLLGGRAAEEVLLGEVSTGASDDLERATAMARQMVVELGMAPEVGPVRFGWEQAAPALMGPSAGGVVSERTSMVLDDAVRSLVLGAYQRAVELVREHRGAVERLAGTLMEVESLSGTEVERLLAGD